MNISADEMVAAPTDAASAVASGKQWKEGNRRTGGDGGKREDIGGRLKEGEQVEERI